MPDTAVQNSLFEDDYLLRELGQVGHVPQVALTELVANAWDAGASKVELVLPGELDGTLTITDDGHGMTSDQFKKRWMTLRYDRVKHQGKSVEFPASRQGQQRTSYGRNGVGRHGLLCFADGYRVETWRGGVLCTFNVSTGSGESPFILRSEEVGERTGSGTRLTVHVDRNLPKADEIRSVLAARFVHDPTFEVFVNGEKQPFQEIGGRVSEVTLPLAGGKRVKIVVIDTTKLNHTSIHHGIAFWVQKRLVGSPSWMVGQAGSIDGRTRFARRYTVIADAEGFEQHVEQDWTAFKADVDVKELFSVVLEYVNKVAIDLASEVILETSEDALTQNRDGLESLGRGARAEVVEFTKALVQEHPTMSPDLLATAVKAVINLEKSKSGAALLQKLTSLSHDDIEGLDRLLDEWSIKDALRVLDEINDRLSVIETISRLSNDPEVDELHTLHPLVLRSRWLFGPEFESQEYCSNRSLKTIAQQIFKSKDAKFINERNRPDVVVLGENSSLQLTGVEGFDPADPSIIALQYVLVIELKKGAFQIGRDEIFQADGYLQDLKTSGAMSGNPFINGWVVGKTIDSKAERSKKLGDPQWGTLKAITFDQLVSTANARLFKLREKLKDRVDGVPTDSLLEKVFASPVQPKLVTDAEMRTVR